MRLHRIVTSLALLALVGALLAGCSSSEDDASTSDAADFRVAEGSGGSGGEGDDTADTGGTERTSAGSTTAGQGGGGGAAADVAEVDLEAVPIAAVDRKIIYTGTTHADVEDVGAAVRAARDAAAVEGGYVFAQDIGPRDGRVVLKVPVDRFDAVFDAIVGIGELEDQQIEAEDVTERFVDLESRQATLATSMDRIRGFLAEATNVDEISRLEFELTRREAEHDVIAGQLRVLRDRTSYGTITAHFRLVDDAADALVGEEDEAGGPPGFGEGLSTGWDAVTTAAAALATALGFLLPFAPVLVAGLLTWWWWRRRSRAPMPTVPTEA